jgi:hypothetical protein
MGNPATVSYVVTFQGKAFLDKLLVAACLDSDCSPVVPFTGFTYLDFVLKI